MFVLTSFPSKPILKPKSCSPKLLHRIDSDFSYTISSSRVFVRIANTEQFDIINNRSTKRTRVIILHGVKCA